MAKSEQVQFLKKVKLGNERLKVINSADEAANMVRTKSET